MTTKTLAWLFIGMTLAMAGCKGDASGTTTGGGTATPETAGTTGGQSGKKLTLAVIPKGTTHEFWKSVHAGAQQAADELGIEIIWKGPLKEDDRDSQIKVVEDFTTQGVDGILLAPLDDTALKVPVENAKKSGIPVLIFDSDLKDTDVVSFVATDNEKGGSMAGDELARLLGGKGNVVMLRYQEGSASTAFREKGFLSAMAKNSGIKVVSENRYAGATVESAQTEAENLLSGLKKPDGSLGVDGIYCPNESSTFGMLRVLQDNGWAGKVKFVGFDASPKLVEGLTAGQINGLLLQNPRKMGYEGVKTMVDYLGKKAVAKRIDTGATLVTKENMAQPEVAKLLEVPK
ncbi:MAG: substrate-binding domain-containing protein [Fimbriimonadaceae bacterium]|nr:substrate-binding domain-containing protein [Fimbriimonadaceae bacterium]